MATPLDFERALHELLERLKLEAVEAWASSREPERREALWHDYQAIDRLTERLSNDFRELIERADQS